MNSFYLKIKAIIDFITNIISVLTWIVRKNYHENKYMEYLDEVSAKYLYYVCHNFFYIYFYIIYYNKINKLSSAHIHYLKEKNEFAFQNDSGSFIKINMKDFLFKELDMNIKEPCSYDNAYIEFFDYYIKYLDIDLFINEITKDKDPIYYYSKVKI